MFIHVKLRRPDALELPKNLNAETEPVEETMFDLAAISDTTILLADGRVRNDSALVAPAPHWLSNDPDGLKRLVKDIVILKKNPSDIYSYGPFTYTEKGPLGIPVLRLEYPNFEYRGQGSDANSDFLNLATTACHRLDLIARKAGAWGPECKVTKIIEPPTKGTLAQATGSGARIGDYIYTVNKLGKDHVRYILENGLGKQVDVTVYFRNVKWEPEDGAAAESGIDVATLDNMIGPLDGNAGATNGNSASEDVSFVFADLYGSAIGETSGNFITLDWNAAGHGWFIDLTPGSNEEFLPTADPNVWKAKPGSAADGKMDMLSVLLHEYGHALGLDHTADAHDFMAATLSPGMRRTMQKLGEIVGLGASKSKLVAGQVPDGVVGTKLGLLAAKSGAGRRVNLNDEGVVELTDNLIISLAGKDLFQVPKALTQGLAPAAQWYRGQMDKLAKMVDKTAPLSVQLVQADKLQGLLLKAAEHSLADPDYAAALREAFVCPGIQDLMQRFGGENGLSGSVLQEKVLSEITAPADKARHWFEPGACFAAGTLVHTKEGLKPIEQIRVGDWVLSKPENGGEQAYKRVLKTIAHEPQRIVRLEYTHPGQDLEDLIRKAQGIKTSYINTTLNHPFWTKEEGWTAPSHLQHKGVGAFNFEDKNGDDANCFSIANIYLSDQPNVGWTSNRWPESMRGYGSLWDYAEHRLVASEAYALEDISFEEHPDPYFKAPVYNLEVEDFHTYYVGEHGIWVHNQNCGGLSIELRNAENPIPAAAGTMEAFVSRTELKNALSARGT